MSKFGDRVKSIFTVDYDDYDDDYYDGYDDGYDDEIIEEVVEEKPPVRPKREKTVVREEAPVKPARATTTTTRSTRSTSSYTSRASRRNSKVVPMRGGDMEVCVMKPSQYESTRDIIDTLLDGKSVILNLEGMKLDLAQRIVDSVSGGCYAIQGNLQKISGYIYLVTPGTVDITGDFQDLVSDSSDYSAASYAGRQY